MLRKSFIYKIFKVQDMALLLKDTLWKFSTKRLSINVERIFQDLKCVFEKNNSKLFAIIGIKYTQQYNTMLLKSRTIEPTNGILYTQRESQGFTQRDDKRSAISLLLVYFWIWKRRHVIKDTI